jgi:hypothetical protein
MLRKSAAFVAADIGARVIAIIPSVWAPKCHHACRLVQLLMQIKPLLDRALYCPPMSLLGLGWPAINTPTSIRWGRL